MRKPGATEILLQSTSGIISLLDQIIFFVLKNIKMKYEEFLQTPHTFMNDVVEILTIKKKWGLELTREEKILQKHIRILTLRSSYETKII